MLAYKVTLARRGRWGQRAPQDRKVMKVHQDLPARRGQRGKRAPRDRKAMEVHQDRRGQKATRAAPHSRCASWSEGRQLPVVMMRPWSPLFVLRALPTERYARLQPKQQGCVWASGKTVPTTKGVLTDRLGAALPDRLP